MPMISVFDGVRSPSSLSSSANFARKRCRGTSRRCSDQVRHSTLLLVCELLRELECGHARCREINRGEELYTRLFAERKVAIPDLQNLMVNVSKISW